MQNYISQGKHIPNLIAGAAVVAGATFLLGSLLVIPNISAPAGTPFTGTTEGLFTLPVANVAIAAGDKAYWDPVNSVYTNVANGNRLSGVFPYAIAAAAGQTGPVFLTGQVS